MRKLLNAVPSRRYPYGHRPLDGTAALRRISLEVGPGMFGLLGPNGAGKTTLMKILTGIIEPTYGAVEVGGYDLRRFRHEIRRLISYLPQDFGVYESLTLEQYLNFLAPLCGLDDLAARRAKVAEVIEFVGLEAVRSKRMKQYSGGMRQRAGIAQLLLDPRPILVVDEPTAGLDPAERVRFRLLLSELARTRVVLLSTHIVEDITSSCNRVAVLHRGSVVYEGGLDGVLDRGRGLIWNVTLPSENVPPIPRRCILFRKYVHDRIFYHYVAENPLPGSEPVSPSFEDAYVALLLQHDAAFSPEPPAE